MPEVTIIIAVRDGMPFLPEAVESILGQTLTDWECLIVDDGSEDGTAPYLQSLRDSRIRVLSGPGRGAGAARNVALGVARSPLCAVADADDLSGPTRLAAQVEALATCPGTVVLGSRYSFRVGSRRLPGSPVPRHHEQIRERLEQGRAGLCHPTIVFRTDAAREIGGYRIEGPGQDFDFELRLLDLGRGSNLQLDLVDYRVHSRSASVAHRGEIRRGIAYAKEAARCRAAGREEPAFAAFMEAWGEREDSRSVWRRVSDGLDDWSATLYRRSIADRAEGKTFRGLLRLAVAAISRPRDAIWQVRSRLGRGKPRSRGSA